MEVPLSFVDFFAGGGKCSLMAAHSPCRAASLEPEYKPAGACWREDGSPEHAPSTILRLGPKVPCPPRRAGAASPIYSPSSSTSRDAMYREYVPGSPEYTPVSRFWKARSPDYAPASTPTIGTTSADYTPASPEYKPVSSFWKTRSPDYVPSSTPTIGTTSADYAPASPEYKPVSSFWKARSPDYAPSSTPTTGPALADGTPASPEYKPVSSIWWAGGSPDYRPLTREIRDASLFYAPDSPEYTPVSAYYWRPSRSPRRRSAFSPEYTPQKPRGRAPSPDYNPSTPLPSSPQVSDAESYTPLPRRHRHHPYQRSSTSTCALRADRIGGARRHLPFHGY